MITHAAANPGLTSVYRRLLTFEKDNSEIHRAEVPAAFRGKSFTDLVNRSSELRNQNINVIPIAILREEQVFVNPRQNEIGHLRPDDVLFAICDNANEIARLGKG